MHQNIVQLRIQICAFYATERFKMPIGGSYCEAPKQTLRLYSLICTLYDRHCVLEWVRICTE